MGKTTDNREIFGLPLGNSLHGAELLADDRDSGHSDTNDHLALLYEQHDEQMAAVVPFIKRGLERNERCLYVVHENTKSDLLNALRDGGIDVETALDTGSLTVHSADEVYLRTGEGEFDRDAMLDRWRDELAESRDDYTGIRAAAEMSWMLDSDTDHEQLATYEAMLNSLYSGDDYTVLCQYDRDRFSREMLSDVIHTHPLVVTDETVWPNFHYMSPAEFRGGSVSPLNIERTVERLQGCTAVVVDKDTADVAEADGERLLLALADETDQRVLADWLGTRYEEVVTPDELGAVAATAFDLCVIDGTTFQRNRDTLIEQKREVEPQILPYLLVQQSDSVSPDPDVQQYVDGVVAMPTDKKTLAWRIDTLLRLRHLSLELAEKTAQIEHLTGAAAHDLRNPLNVAQLRLQEIDASDVRDTIVSAHDRMETLIEDVLAVAQVDESLTEVDLEPIEFSTLVSESWESVLTAEATLQVEEHPNQMIRVVPSLCQQLLENLFRNAVEHGDDDTRVRVGMLNRTGFYVADDGPGIPPDERDTVFETNYSTGKGSGLGLAVVKRVAESHGWNVFLTESEWGGARFEFVGVERP